MAPALKHPALDAAQGPRLRRAVWIVSALVSALCGVADLKAAPQSPDSEAAVAVAPTPKRGFRTFLPKAGEAIDDPASQVVQLLLDRQDKGDFDSYMVQVLFRGKPSQRTVRTLRDRVEIDFHDTGKPSTRLAKIRGGAVEASSIEELFYKDMAVKSVSESSPAEASTTGASQSGGAQAPHVKRLVRLTLFMHEKAEMKFRDTLDRTLIHFRLPKAHPNSK
jgi:hypothetical protein